MLMWYLEFVVPDRKLVPLGLSPLLETISVLIFCVFRAARKRLCVLASRDLHNDSVWIMAKKREAMRVVEITDDEVQGAEAKFDSFLEQIRKPSKCLPESYVARFYTEVLAKMDNVVGLQVNVGGAYADAISFKHEDTGSPGWLIFM